MIVLDENIDDDDDDEDDDEEDGAYTALPPQSTWRRPREATNR